MTFKSGKFLKQLNFVSNSKIRIAFIFDENNSTRTVELVVGQKILLIVFEGVNESIQGATVH